MKYHENLTLKDGRRCLLRSAGRADAAEMTAVFRQTHGETDYLLSYPDENSFDEEKERAYLEKKEASRKEAELCALVDRRIVGMAGIEAVGWKDKVKHRASFGISVARDFWGLGVGRALTLACVRCARQAGYAQLELDVAAENARAVALYESVGFREYGRNPRGFYSRRGVWQELVLMRLELDPPADSE